MADASRLPEPRSVLMAAWRVRDFFFGGSRRIMSRISAQKSRRVPHMTSGLEVVNNAGRKRITGP